MKYKDIIEFLFNKKEEEGLFYLEDTEMEKLKKETITISHEIFELINKKVHPKCRKKLLNLLNKYDDAETLQVSKENELFYKNGVADGVKFILTALSIRW